jgi:L-histidine N-alpha-methyltransferase
MKPMRVDLSALGLDISFTVGEEIHTGISTKFMPGELENQLQASGFETTRWWTDEHDYMGVFLARAI